MPNVVYAECRKETLFAECHYAECHYADCRGAAPIRLGSNTLTYYTKEQITTQKSFTTLTFFNVFVVRLFKLNTGSPLISGFSQMIS
jgi:hypothetical protein